tara:strand:- start:547 stop:1932 length:1386 start_codon:yes stop_codon:yes gene_type:complete
MDFNLDPIIGISTPSGKGGISVIRLSGTNLISIVKKVCNFKNSNTLKNRYATYLDFIESDGSIIDKGIIIYFKSPNSFTGEDVLELHGHGGPIVVKMIMKRCLEVGKEIGLRIANPGEFSYRAFYNNKIDLAQAEAVSDLIEADSEIAAKLAVKSLTGMFSKEIKKIVGDLINVRIILESNIDFPDDEIEFLEYEQIKNSLNQIRNSMNLLIRKSKKGSVLREGLKIALVGRPNVGKSSLLNLLSDEKLAIVTPHAGTTRDKIQNSIYINGLLVNLIDTAGINTNQNINEIEKIGISITWEVINEADLVLYLFDSVIGKTKVDKEIIEKVKQKKEILYIWNKIDLTSLDSKVEKHLDETHIYISIFKNLGLNLLINSIEKKLDFCIADETLYLARQRHLEELKEALGHVNLASSKFNDSVIFYELIAEELRLAQNSLNKITGEFTSDDLLGEIFKNFCIGK